MNRHWRRGIAGVALVCATHQVGAAPTYEFVRYADAKAIANACQTLLTDQSASEKRMAALTEVDTAGLLAQLDAMARRYEDTLGPLSLLASVHPDKAIRDAADACDLSYQAFSSAFLQNPAIHALLKNARTSDPIDARLLRDQLDSFEDSGVGLSLERQQRARQINTELTRLSQLFDRRVREDKTQVAFTSAELAGVPAKVWRQARRDAQGRYLLGLDYPSSSPVIEQAHRASSRERMWRAFQSQGGAENLKTLAELAALKREYAALFDFSSYADFALRRRMASNAPEVERFLGTVKDAVAARERADVQLLREAKAAHQAQDAASTVLRRWDAAYYTERLRRARYAVDQEQFRAYFPPDASLQFIFKLAERLFGVRFAPLKQTLWHPDARAYAVSDANGKGPLGTLFVDMFPRPDKYNHAAVWPIRGTSTLAGRAPAAALVVNFNRQGLSIEELETLLHEFGHALHNLLSTTRYSLQAGTSVQLDFVEAPSQMLEDWVYDPQVLSLFQQVCKACKPVPADLLARAERARHVGKGIQVARQHLYASYDLRLHGAEPAEPLALWSQMEAATPLGHVTGTMLPAGFGHLASGYAAGYYSYLWSLVLAEDLRTAFVGHRLDAAVGKRYRDTVLAQGGQMSPQDLMQAFLGRPSNSQAFFDALARQ